MAITTTKITTGEFSVLWNGETLPKEPIMKTTMNQKMRIEWIRLIYGSLLAYYRDGWYDATLLGLLR